MKKKRNDVLILKMKITKSDIKAIAQDLLAFIEEKDIKAKKDLEGFLGERFVRDVKQGRVIEITLRPSAYGVKAHTISYSWDGVGIPLEVKINYVIGLTHIILKAESVIEGYNAFASTSDPFSNIMQNKFRMTTEIDWLKQELDILVRS